MISLSAALKDDQISMAPPPHTNFTHVCPDASNFENETSELRVVALRANISTFFQGMIRLKPGLPRWAVFQEGR